MPDEPRSTTPSSALFEAARLIHDEDPPWRDLIVDALVLNELPRLGISLAEAGRYATRIGYDPGPRKKDNRGPALLGQPTDGSRFMLVVAGLRHSPSVPATLPTWPHLVTNEGMVLEIRHAWVYARRATADIGSRPVLRRGGFQWTSNVFGEVTWSTERGWQTCLRIDEEESQPDDSAILRANRVRLLALGYLKTTGGGKRVGDGSNWPTDAAFDQALREACRDVESKAGRRLRADDRDAVMRRLGIEKSHFYDRVKSATGQRWSDFVAGRNSAELTGMGGPHHGA